MDQSAKDIEVKSGGERNNILEATISHKSFDTVCIHRFGCFDIANMGETLRALEK